MAEAKTARGSQGGLRKRMNAPTRQRRKRNRSGGDRAMAAFIRKLKKLLKQDFPGSEFEFELPGPGRLGGLLTWAGFEGMEHIERQRMVWKTLREKLAEEEYFRIAGLLSLTPDEMTAARSA